jgi:hypothetical protein
MQWIVPAFPKESRLLDLLTLHSSHAAVRWDRGVLGLLSIFPIQLLFNRQQMEVNSIDVLQSFGYFIIEPTWKQSILAFFHSPVRRHRSSSAARGR